MQHQRHKFWRLFCLLFSLCASAATAEDAVSRTVFGPHPDLTAGSLALQAGDFAAGIRLTLRGLAQTESPRDRADAYANLCAGYASTRQYNLAVDYCSQSLQLRPDNWRAYHNRGCAQLGRGDIEAAIDDAQLGLEIAPKAVLLHRLLETAQRSRRQQHRAAG